MNYRELGILSEDEEKIEEAISTVYWKIVGRCKKAKADKTDTKQAFATLKNFLDAIHCNDKELVFIDSDYCNPE